MYDKKKLKFYKYIVYGIIGVLLVLVGFGLGSFTESGSDQHNNSTKTENSKSGLTDGVVKTFLVQYFTKKDIGENNERIKPLMTSAAYTKQLKDDKSPVNAAYKGMVIDQVFTDSENYVDSKKLTAIVRVNYTNTQLIKPGDMKTAVKDQPNTRNIKLTFIKQNGKYLVDQIEDVTLVEPGDDPTQVSSSSSVTVDGAGNANSSSVSSTDESKSTDDSAPDDDGIDDGGAYGDGI